MVSIVDLKKSTNKDAEALLRDVSERIASGDINAIAVSWVTSSGSIGGDISSGENKFMMWAAMEHCARSFYTDSIEGE